MRKRSVQGGVLWIVFGLACIAFGTGSTTSPAEAYDLPAVNLGFTSFLDGGPPSGPGLYAQQYFQYWTADKFRGPNGERLFPSEFHEDLNVFISLTQFIYQSNQALPLGGKWGLDVIIPVVSTSLDFNVHGGLPEDNSGGLGDILIGPFLQWDPIMGSKGPIFMHRIEFQMLLPTGKYDRDKEINPGSNFFSFNPYWSGTWFITPHWTTSVRAHYLWNALNDDPNRGFGDVRDTRAGQAVHFNFATEYEFVPNRFRAGFNGYFLQQLTDTEVEGQNVYDRKERVLGIGPGAVFHWTKDTHVFFNLYFETAVENRPEGKRLNLRFVHHF